MGKKTRIEELYQESFRQLLHLATFLFIIPLRWFSYRYAVWFGIISFFWNWKVMPGYFPDAFRSEEQARRISPGMLWYSVSVLLLGLCFPLPVLAGAWAVLSISDSLATLFGKFLGKKSLFWNRAKTWLGFLVYFFSAGISGWAFFLFTRANVEASSSFWFQAESLGKMMAVSPLPLLGISFLSGLAGALMESLPFSRINDNLTSPLVYALIMTLMVVMLN